METTYYDRLKATFEGFEEKTPSPSAQLILLHILYLDNCQGRTGLVKCSDSRLALLTGLSSKTITAAKRQLKNLGFLDFKTNSKKPRAATVYKLPEPFSVKYTLKTTVNSTVNDTLTLAEKFGIPIIPVREEKEKEKEKNSPTSSNAREEKISENSEAVKQAWLDCEGERLRGGVAIGLIGLEKTYGTQEVVDAIYAAHQANSQPRLSFNFVKSVLLRTMEGGKKANGKIVSISGESWEQQRPSWLD